MTFAFLNFWRVFNFAIFNQNRENREILYLRKVLYL